MTITFDRAEFLIASSTAAVKVDGEARPQLVSESLNPGLYLILELYEIRTGTPPLINTSFNTYKNSSSTNPPVQLKNIN